MADAPIAQPAALPQAGVVERASSRWVLATGLGAIVAAVVASRPTLLGWGPVLAPLIAIAAGWLVAILIAPWKLMVEIGRDRRALSRLARDLRRANDPRRDFTLQSLILDRDDELGTLSRAIHDAVARCVADRRQSERLQRTMDDAIRRETDRATIRLQREATTDPLTGLGNRRTMERRLEELFNGDRRRQSDNVVAMVIDIDLFKEVNDALGHDAGDQCLAFLGDLLTSTLRREDCAIRIGGDEFVVLMPNQTIDEARELAQRLSDLFGQMPWRHRPQPRATLSIGLASAWCSDPDGATELLRRADVALYEAKRGGRSTIRAYAGDDGRKIA